MSLYSLEAFAAGQLLTAEGRTLERDEVCQIEEDLQDIQQARLQRTLTLETRARYEVYQRECSRNVPNKRNDQSPYVMQTARMNNRVAFLVQMLMLDGGPEMDPPPCALSPAAPSSPAPSSLWPLFRPSPSLCVPPYQPSLFPLFRPYDAYAR